MSQFRRFMSKRICNLNIMKQLMTRFSVCDYLMVAKFIMGIALITIGIMEKEWLGIIGLWPITDFIYAVFFRKNTSCAYEPKAPKKSA